MSARWTPQAVMESVRRHVATSHFERAIRIEEVDLVDGDVRVVFSGLHPQVRNGVRFSLAGVPVGPLTGEVCSSLDEWATEVAFALDEASGTREMDRAEERVERDGVVLLRWWTGGSWTL